MQDDRYQSTTVRNRGIVSDEAQEKLRTAVVAIAGCGAGGGSTAVSLARLGVRHFRLADPDCIELTNLNRQEGAFESTLGQNKAKVIGRMLHDVDPAAEVQLWPEGVTAENADPFLKGADICLEEIDYRKPRSTLLVHQRARALSVPLMTALPVAWNAFLFFFEPDGMTYEEYTGIDPTTSFSSVDLRPAAYVPEPPAYLSEELLKDVLAEKIEIPAVDSGVKLAAALLGAYCTFYLAGMKALEPVPHYYSAGDLYERQASFVSDCG